MSKISVRQLFLQSVTCAMGRKLSLAVFPQLGKLGQLFFSALSVWPFNELKGLLERGFRWVGLKRRLLPMNSVPQRAQPHQTPIPRGRSSTRRKAKILCFVPRSHYGASLNIHSFVGRKFMGATDTTKIQCYVEPGLWGQGKQLNYEFRNSTRETCFLCP